MPTHLTHEQMVAELTDLARDDDTLATTFEAIPCLDCQSLGISAIACASREHHDHHRSNA